MNAPTPGNWIRHPELEDVVVADGGEFICEEVSNPHDMALICAAKRLQAACRAFVNLDSIGDVYRMAKAALAASEALP